VSDLVVVNPQRLVWNPAENVEDLIRYGLRSMDDYVGDIKSRDALHRLIRSRKRIAPALWYLAKRGIGDTVARLPQRWRATLRRDPMAERIQALFTGLSGRGTRVSLVYSDGDPGLRELRAYYGAFGRNLRLPHVSVTMVPDADHNLTTTRASNWLLDHLIAFGRDGVAPEAELAALSAGFAAEEILEPARMARWG
jgi:hypothetical protein